MSEETSILARITQMVRHGQLKAALVEIEDLEASGALESKEMWRGWRILRRIRNKRHLSGENVSTSINLRSLILKSTILEELGENERALQVALEGYAEAEKDPGHLPSKMDAMANHASVLCNLSKNHESLEVVEQGLDLFPPLKDDQRTHLLAQQAKFVFLLGKNQRMLGELEEAKISLEKARLYYLELGDKAMEAETEALLGIISFYQGELDIALEFFLHSLPLFEQIEYKKQIAADLNNVASVYFQRGNIDDSLDYQRRSLAIKEEINHKVGIAISLNNIGELLILKGESTDAMEHLGQALTLFEDLGNDFYATHTLDTLVTLSTDLGVLDKAEEFLEKLKVIDDRNESANISQKRKVAEAIFLKTSSRAKNRGRAEELLTAVINEEVADHSTTTKAMIHLADLLLEDLRRTGEGEILEEITKLTVRLEQIATEQQSFSVLAQTNLLQAKLSLLKLDLSQAKQLFTQAELVATENDLRQIALKISVEHDKFLATEKTWEEAKTTQKSITDLLAISDLDDSITQMLTTKGDTPEVEQEDPVMFTIIADSGLSIFSKTFESASRHLDEQQLAGFLSAINSFSGEVFSSSLDRARLGEYTLVLVPLSKELLMTYVFKGPTYHASQKVQKVIETLKNDQILSETLSKATRGVEILPEDVQDHLTSLITNVVYPTN